MNFSSFRHFFIVILLFGSIETVMSQEWNTARLSVLYGSTIPFNFTNIEKIKNGLEITNGTVFGISMADSSRVGHILKGFVLSFRAFNYQNTLKGDVFNLPLNRIRVKAENASGLETGFSHGYKDLTADWIPLFTYTQIPWVKNLNWLDNQLRISLDCGKPTPVGNGTLMGEDPDYYNVEIEYELEPIFF